MKTGLKLCLAVAAVVLITPMSVSASDGQTMCRIIYDIPDVDIDFPSGYRIKTGGDLTFTATSERFDLSKSGIIFYEYNDASEYPVPREKYEYPFTTETFGKSVEYTFRGISADAEMVFVDLVPYNAEETDPEPVPVPDEANRSESSLMLSLSLISLAAAVVLLCMTAYVLNYFNRVIKHNGRDGI